MLIKTLAYAFESSCWIFHSMPMVQDRICYGLRGHGKRSMLTSESCRYQSSLASWSSFNSGLMNINQIHLESGRCTKSGLDRQKLNTMIQQMDRRNVITKPMLTMANYDPPQATQRTWNGRAYECYFCDKEFSQLHGLNNHLKSPAHEQPLYHCPNPGCHKPYKVLSGLVQHLESESCGAIKFVNVQKQARNGIQNMVGRMIAN